MKNVSVAIQKIQRVSICPPASKPVVHTLTHRRKSEGSSSLPLIPHERRYQKQADRQTESNLQQYPLIASLPSSYFKSFTFCCQSVTHRTVCSFQFLLFILSLFLLYAISLAGDLILLHACKNSCLINENLAHGQPNYQKSKRKKKQFLSSCFPTGHTERRGGELLGGQGDMAILLVLFQPSHVSNIFLVSILIFSWRRWLY
jgi:hypothetical protein